MIDRRRRFRAVRIVAVVGLALLGVPSLAANYQITGVTLLPQQFFVGDRVEMRVTVRTATAVDLVSPDRLPVVDWGEIHQIRLASRGLDWDIRIVFTSYQPGTRTIPAIDLGGIVVTDLSVHVPSILAERQAELTPTQPQILPPGTRLWLSVIAVILTIVPVSLLVSLRWGRRHLSGFLERRRERRPYRRLARALSLLSAEVEQIDGREFYIALLEHVRRFLSSTLDVDCMAATTAELDTHLDRLLHEPEQRIAVLSLFRRGDLVKFAAANAPVPQRREDIALLLSIAENLGSERRIPVRRKQRVGV